MDALSAAIAFQQAVAEANRDQPEDTRIVFRIGLHLGDLIVEGDDLYGEGVNVAARLEAEAPAGGIIVSRAVREAVEGRIRAKLHALGELNLKNIERPIRAFRVDWEEADWPAGTPVSKATEPAPLKADGLTKSEPPRLSIVVLPFENMGGDAEQEYFVDGVTESLTTDLSRMSGMLVIGRNTAFTYKGKHVDLKQIGHELSVRYVLEGSVQRSGNRMRVNAKLVDTETGNQLWAERFDKPVADLFDMQDEIVARLAGQLGTQLITAEARRAERAPNPSSMDVYFQGMACSAKGNTLEYLSQASGYFARALTLDPSNVEALVWRAYVEARKVSVFVVATDDRAAQFAAAEAALTKALSLAPQHAFAHQCLGYVQVQTKRALQGIAECERALALDRNLAGAHAMIGFGKFLIGRGEETEAHVQEALRLSPRDIFAYTWMSWAGTAKLFLGSDEDAVTRFRRALEINRNAPVAHFSLAAALAQLNRPDEARFAGVFLRRKRFRCEAHPGAMAVFGGWEVVIAITAWSGRTPMATNNLSATPPSGNLKSLQKITDPNFSSFHCTA